MDAFKAYLTVKNQISSKLTGEYEKRFWRKLRRTTQILSQKTDNAFLKKFAKCFGENCVVSFGDWSPKRQMKYCEPSKGKSLRNLLRKGGHLVYHFDEFHTSKHCSNCGAIMEKYYYRRSKHPRNANKRNKRLVHGALRCTNKECRWHVQRDHDSADCIQLGTFCELYNLPRPPFLRRGVKSEDVIPLTMIHS